MVEPRGREGMSRRSFLKVGAAGAAAVSGTVCAEAPKAADTLAYRTLGRTGLKITAVSMGAFQTSEQAVFEAAFDLGINYVDTARNYVGGKSERLLGKALKASDKKVYVATKVWLDDKAKMLQDLETSLSELMLDCVDVLFLHKCDAREEIFDEDNRAVMKHARDNGKARFLGVSTHDNTIEVINAVIEDPEKLFDVILVTYSFKSGDDIKQAIARAAEAGLGVIAMKTQAGGYKTKELGDINPHQAALRWVLQDPSITAAIPSMANLQQVQEDVAVMGMPMTSTDVATLKRYGDAIAPFFCHHCGACRLTCAKHIDIPSINRCLMYAEGYGDARIAGAAFAEIPLEASLRACADCAECTARCAHGLDLGERLRTATAFFA